MIHSYLHVKKFFCGEVFNAFLGAVEKRELAKIDLSL